MRQPSDRPARRPRRSSSPPTSPPPADPPGDSAVDGDVVGGCAVPGAAGTVDVVGSEIPGDSTPPAEPWSASPASRADVDRAAVHEGADLLTSVSFSGTPDQLREKADAFAAAGVTEIVYQPAGPDIVGELARMADVFQPSTEKDVTP